ncbi:MAG TPA: preprotein translocase subunit SecE [Petrotoga sp.]|nr:MAG: Preprotein translocase, SecE subunit [Petrotoga mobilis]HBT51255.1 preprotein translocase subunit SecE [Petrotoga sp.]
MSKFWIFLTSVWQEAKKINWPTRKELLNSTLVVLIVIAIFAVYLFAIDFGLLQLFSWLVYPVFLRGSGIPSR